MWYLLKLTVLNNSQGSNNTAANYSFETLRGHMFDSQLFIIKLYQAHYIS